MAQDRTTGASVSINPKRVVFDRSGKTATVYLLNPGGSAGLFDVTLVDRVMLPSGQILPQQEAAASPETREFAERLHSARPLLLATPRRVRLEPGKGQTIRIRAQGAAQLPPGEYRTHLTVTAVPPRDTGLTAERASGIRPEGISLRVTSVLGISIPVILRTAPPDVRAAIENVRLTKEQVGGTDRHSTGEVAVVSLELVRRGESSLYGDVEIRSGSKGGGKTPLAVVHGVGVYPETERRQLQTVLTRAPRPGEKLTISFVDDDVSPGKNLAEFVLSLP